MKIDRKILENLSKKYSDNEIAKIFNVTGRTICNHRKFHNIPSLYRLKRYRLYSINHDFFHNIDSKEKAYILGFATADGYVDKKGKTLTIAIQKKDTHILKEIRKLMNSNAPIRTKKKSGYGNKDLSVIHFCSKVMVKSLTKFGIVPKKSYNAFYPTIPSIFDQHYIRGLMDGDGNINNRNFSLVGTFQLLNKVNEIIFSHIGHKLSSVPCNGHPRLVGYRKNKNILSWIYKDSSIHLKRKYKTFCKYW